uniref:Uncharacterized protein n=1 Tax=Arundo donax TaxID=35708 RepID=A0A0A9BI96_ARUDO
MNEPSIVNCSFSFYVHINNRYHAYLL